MSQIDDEYGESVNIDVPAVLFRISVSYRDSMSELELYEATRGTWRMNPFDHRPVYAFAVADGIVRAVYEIDEWHPAMTTPYLTRFGLNKEGRFEFTGKLASNTVLAKFLGKSVNSNQSVKSRNPVTYVNC